MKNRLIIAAGAALACALLASSAQAADRKVTIKNATGITMNEFYASTANTDDWEENIFGKDELAPGEEIEVDIDDGTGKCVFDFLGVFDSGDKVEKRGVNVCKIGTFTFNE